MPQITNIPIENQINQSFDNLYLKIGNLSKNLDNKEIDIAIGSDPEFVILCGSNIESATEVLSRIGGYEVDRCTDCEVCSNCESCEFESEIDWDDEDNIKKSVNKNVDKEINNRLNWTSNPERINEYNTYIKSNINFEMLKESIFKNLMNKQLSSDNYNSFITTALMNILKHNNVFINTKYEYYIFWYEIFNGYIDFDFLSEINKAEIIFETSNIYTNNNKAFLSIRDNEELNKSNIDEFNKIKEKRITNIRESKIYYEYYKFHNIFYSIYKNFMMYIINHIYEDIETRSDEPICNYDRASCGMCDNCDSCDNPDFTGSEIEIGCDGDEVTGEFRPVPKNNPINHFNEIKKLVNTLFDMLTSSGVCGEDNFYQIKAGGYNGGKKLGGHIHIGFPYDINENINLKNDNMQKLALYLSYHSGILLKRLEDYRDIEHRQPFGRFDDWRSKDYGIEWRMPSSWLIEPEICKGALCLTYIVAYNYFWLLENDTTTLDTQLSEIYTKFYKHGTYKEMDIRTENFYDTDYNDLISKEFTYKYTAYITPEHYVGNEIKYIIYNISQMKKYNEYQESIELILQMVLRESKWYTQDNIFKRWISKEKYDKVRIKELH